jgi:uncharacterized protein (TIGR02246 family)
VSALTSPAATIEQFARHHNERDLDAAAALYDDDAVLVAAPEVEARGRDAIVEALRGLFARGATLAVTVDRVVEAGDTALVLTSWTMAGTMPDGQAMSRPGHSADVLRRQPDGRWLLLVDNPWA